MQYLNCLRHTAKPEELVHATTAGMKHLHLHLRDDIDEQLRAVAARAKVPPTTLAREEIDLWLWQQLRKTRHDVIAAYAAEAARTVLDLDTDLETAGIEHLIKTCRKSK
jgi:hypothetical protein